MRKFVLLVLMSLFSAGCTSIGNKEGSTFLLPEEYRPLEEISERGFLMGLVITGDSTITTVGKTAYVEDLEKWLAERPVGSLRFRAVVRHEQEHSRRQLDAGVKRWLARYLSDAEFAWLEEQIGWYWQLRILQQGGARINVDGVAKTLAGYKIATGGIVSFEDAKQWVSDVLAGRWSPPE